MKKAPRSTLAACAMLAIAALLAGCAAPQQATVFAREAPPQATACPAKVPDGTSCLTGKDSAGALYLIAMPAKWNGTLVLHAHGGPFLGDPTLARGIEDLERWAIVVKAGYAYAGSTFRQGGVAVRAAAEDTERLRHIFNDHVTRPQFTVLHGQSWGGNVAAVGASLFTRDASGKRPYDAVLLTSGVLAGGTRAYNHRMDLRAIYQALCGNHPRADEPAYPLNIGLPVESTLTSADLTKRVNECLALDKPEAQRTAEQQRKIRTITDAVKIPATTIASHLAWGTFHFRDIVSRRTAGRSPFGNSGVQYAGSPDVAALNAVVPRYTADPGALRMLAADTDPDGRIPVPVLTVHGIHDATAFVEMQHTFRGIMEQAGTAGHLVQTFTDDSNHSYLGDAVYPTLLAALTTWARSGAKPTPADIATLCVQQFEAVYGKSCRFRPDYQPSPLETRVPARR